MIISPLFHSWEKGTKNSSPVFSPSALTFENVLGGPVPAFVKGRLGLFLAFLKANGPDAWEGAQAPCGGRASVSLAARPLTRAG